MITAEEARAAIYSDPNRARCIAEAKKWFEQCLREALDENKFKMDVFWNSVWYHPVSGSGKQHNIAKEMIEWVESLGYKVKPSTRHSGHVVEW